MGRRQGNGGSMQCRGQVAKRERELMGDGFELGRWTRRGKRGRGRAGELLATCRGAPGQAIKDKWQCASDSLVKVSPPLA